MKSNLKIMRMLSVSSMILLAMLLTACGGGDDGGAVAPSETTNTVSGTVAAGAPIVGTVNIRGADGKLSYSAINADGSFTVDVSALTPAFVMWAEGTANGKSVKLYSTIDEPGTANVTPATHIIMAMALGDDPDKVYIQDPNASAPEQADIEAAKQEILTRLESVFATLDMPEDFDLMNGQFEADGTGFDKVLDAVDMSYGDTEKTVELVDKASGQTLYEKNVETGEVDPGSLDADQIDTIVTGGMSQMDAMRAIMEKIETLYATSRPSLQELQQQLRPLMADDYLDDGYGPDDTLEAWADDEGSPVGFTIDGLAIHRPMVELTFGDVDPWTIREFADNYDEGVWGVGRYTYRDYSQVFVTSFVRKDGDWKWYGNRRPFRQWRFGAEAVRFISPQESSVIVSGLEVYVYDVGNLALDNFGIDFFMVLNDALPELTDEDGNTYHTLIMGRRSDVDTGYRIDNVTTSYWDGWYLERDGLDIDSLSNPEFVFVGVDSSGPTAVHVWIDLLGGKPLKGTELDTTYFPVITTPSSLDPLDLNIPGEVTASWSNPTGMYTDWIELGWYDAQDYTKIELDNPAWNDPTKNFEDWTSYTFDTSQTTIHPVTGAWIFVEAEDLSGREFATQIDIY